MGNKKLKKIIFSGGGTGGSVTPLLALVDDLSENDGYEFFFIGGRAEIEKQLVKEKKIAFAGIFSGKLRRYMSWKNFFDPFLIFLGFLQSVLMLTKQKPDLVITAGSFVSVPVAWAAWMLRIPVLIIQLDVRPGLANRIMAPTAAKVAVSFKTSLLRYGKKAVWTGAPFSVKKEKIKKKKEEIMNEYGFDKDLPLLLIMGGGTGAAAINELVRKSIDDLSSICNLIHISGEGKSVGLKRKNYKQIDFLPHEELLSIIRSSDLVVSRAGLGTIVELSGLKKPAIVIPMPNSHQEDNACALSKAGAAMVLEENEILSDNFLNMVKKLLIQDSLKNDLSKKIGDFMKENGSKNIIKLIEETLK
ncbi:undecaprenyldiphospho-muramoylpentapeptide beta-N-acetylglucosaminyltransferase [Candidatus Falkowbacteria bacterium]|nr:undecaprenyldiphospho-muramoylpentapeptide beta-N-acetylglucosaminyltransferase [Candidatus Falkowbacteria bacterium]